VLFKPRELARAVAPWLAIFLIVTGIGACGVGILVEHAQLQEFATTGRPVMGLVRANGGTPTDAARALMRRRRRRVHPQAQHSDGEPVAVLRLRHDPPLAVSPGADAATA
jgi:hypothetical protein